MPTYSIEGPDGKTYSIDGPEGASREQVIYMIQRRLQEQSKPQGFLGSFKQSASTLGDLPEAINYALADSSKRQPRKEFLDASAPKGATTSWDDVKDLATFWDFTKELAGGSAGFIAPAAAVAKAASYLPVVGPYARGIGLATYGLGYLVDQLGTQAQVQQEAIDKGESYYPTSLARAAAGAYQSTVLDVAQLNVFSNVMRKFPFMGKLMGDMGEQGTKEAEEQLIDSYLAGTLKPSGSIMKGVAKGLAFEIPQEVAQTAIDRLQSRQSLTDADAMKAYKEAAIGAAILGGPMGGIEGGLEYAKAKKAALAPTPEEAPEAAEPPPGTARLVPEPPSSPDTGTPGLPPPQPPGAGPGGQGAGPGPGAGPGAGPGGAGPTPRPFDDDDLNIAREALLNNKGKKRLTAGGMRYALSAAMRKAGRNSKMARMDEILRHLTRDGFIRPDDNGNVTFGYVEPEPETFDAEAEEITPAGPPLGVGQAPPVEVPSTPPAVTPPAAPGTQGQLDFGDTGAGVPPTQPSAPQGPQGPQAPQGAAPTQGEFDFGQGAIDEATARAARRAEIIKQQNVTEGIIDWDSRHRVSRTDDWFEGDYTTRKQRSAEGDRASQYQAHGMSKVSNLTAATRDLVNILTNGLDPNRRGGVLDTAPLVKKEGTAGLQGATATGEAYADGPFQIVAKKGVQTINSVDAIGGILVNEAVVDSGVVEHLRSLFPNLVIEPYSNISSFLDQMEAQTQTTTQEATPKKRETLSLRKKPDPRIAEAVSFIKQWGLPNDVALVEGILKSKNFTDEDVLDAIKEPLGHASALKKLSEYKERLAKVLPNIPANEKFDTFHKGEKGKTEPTTANELASWLDARIKEQSSPKVRKGFDSALLNDNLLTAEEVLAKYEGKPASVVEEESTVDEDYEPTELNELDFADAATAGLEEEPAPIVDPMEAINTARQKAYDIYPGEGVPARAARKAFMQGYSTGSGNGEVSKAKKTKAQQKAYEEGYAFAQQQAQGAATSTPESTQGRGASVEEGTRASVPKPVPTRTAKPRANEESKPAGVGASRETTERPAPREAKVKRPLTPAEKARDAAISELTKAINWLSQSNRITSSEMARIGTELIYAKIDPEYDYKTAFAEVRKFIATASARAGTDTFEASDIEPEMDEEEMQERDVSREYDENDEIDYEDAFEDERGPRELRFSRTADERWYYSALTRFFEGVKQTKATVAQWLGMLSNATSVKPDEIEWTGIEEFLKLKGAEPNAVVSKQEIVDYLNNNGIKVDSYELSFGPLKKAEEAYLAAQNALSQFLARMQKKYPGLWVSGYDIDGTALPSMSGTDQNIYANLHVRYEDKKEEYKDLKNRTPRWSSYTVDGNFRRRNYREILLQFNSPELYTDYVHYEDAPNILAFMRVDTRVDKVTGKKILFVHEIQSDWGQDIRDFGAKGDFTTVPREVELTKLNDDTWNAEVMGESFTLFAKTREEALREYQNTVRFGGLKGPFVTSTEAWTSLALKKLMVMAVNENYDRIAFASGAMTSARAGKGYRYINVEFAHDRSKNTYDLTMYSLGIPYEVFGVEEKDLAKALNSKKVAAKVVAAKNAFKKSDYIVFDNEISGVVGLNESPTRSQVTSIDLDQAVEVPGAGMVGYYDNIVPKILKRLADKLGGTVGKQDFFDIASKRYKEIHTNPDIEFDAGNRTVLSLDIDAKLRDSVQKKVPLFRAAGKGSMKAKDVQGIVDSVVKGWTNAPPIKVVQSITDLPAKLRDSIPFSVGGFYADGTVYLVADGMDSAERVQATLFHESLAHYGLREEFGKGLDPLLDNIYKTNPAMRAAVDNWLKNNPDTYADLSQDEQRRAAMEEVFAEQSESGPIKNMGLRAALSRIMSFIKDFLRRMGFNIAYSDADVANILAKAHDRVISGGKKGVEGGALRFRRTQAPIGANETPEQTIARLKKELDEAYSRDSAFTKAMKFRFTHKGFEWLAKRVQNDRRPAKVLEDDLRASGQLELEADLNGSKFNNLYTQLMLSSQRAFHYMVTKINKPLAEFKKSIREYATANKLDMDAALARLHTYAMALHEPERRMAKYVQNVPLNNITRVTIPGLPNEGTFADHRDFIMKQLYGWRRVLMTKQEAQNYRKILDDIIAGRYGQAVDANGVSGMIDAKGNTVTGLSLDPMSRDYDVIGGYSQAQFAEFRRQYNAEKEVVDKIFAHMKQVQERTIELNKIANYWSPQVDNIRHFYGWNHYVPFKSRKGSKISADDDKLDFTSDRLGVGGTEYLDVTQQFSGRMTDSENPLLQVMMESASAAMRAGRHGVTQSLVNLKEQGHVKAKKLGTIKFEDRYKAVIDIDSYLGNNPDQIRPRVVFHYKPGGEIEIWAINDKEIAESIRRAFQTPNPVWQAVNRVTSFFGHLHTRYNPAFHLYNYLRDSLHNAWLIGTDVGKEARAKYIEQIAMLTANGGLLKAGKVSRLYANDDIAAIEAMWKNPDGSVKDQFVKDIYDYLRVGGRTTFIQSLSMQKEADQLLKELRGNGVLDKARDVRDVGLKWFDIAADMFEFTSRVAAFSVVKADRRAKGMSEEEANIDAAAFAKELANFEQVGLWGQKLGAFFMFFRPSATGAVRNIDSLRPIWQSEQAYIDSVAKSAKDTPEKLRKLRQDYRRRRENAINSLKMLVAVGAAMYLLALALGEDDEAERNEVATDDKALWTRNLRLPLRWLGYEGDNPWFNIPWGFGFGAFGAAGAQTMALVTGGQSLKEYMGNTVNIALDSFLPIPVSRVNPFENPGIWLVSSGMPSLVRPIVDFQMNMDSLGRQIYSNRQTKYGDAYTSGINNPEHINSLARWMADTFDIDVGPNTLNFWASNYADAVSRVAGAAYDVNLALGGEKELSAKVALMPISSFLGAKSNYDGRQFAKMQEEADDFIAKLNRLENTNPEKLQEFLRDNPNAYEIKYVYNRMVNGQLRKIATERKRILSDPNMTAGERRERAQQLNYIYNASKRSLMEAMAAYGLDY